MTVHNLKCNAPFFEHVRRGEKLFEVRRDDRHFQIGDIVTLREVRDGQETRRPQIETRVVYVLYAHEIPGHPLADGYVVLGLALGADR